MPLFVKPSFDNLLSFSSFQFLCMLPTTVTLSFGIVSEGKEVLFAERLTLFWICQYFPPQSHHGPH